MKIASSISSKKQLKTNEMPLNKLQNNGNELLGHSIFLSIKY